MWNDEYSTFTGVLHSARFFKTSSMASHRWVVNIEAATPTLHHKRLLRRRGVRNEKENATHLNNNSNHSTGMEKTGKTHHCRIMMRMWKFIPNPFTASAHGAICAIRRVAIAVAEIMNSWSEFASRVMFLMLVLVDFAFLFFVLSNRHGSFRPAGAVGVVFLIEKFAITHRNNL